MSTMGMGAPVKFIRNSHNKIKHQKYIKTKFILCEPRNASELYAVYLLLNEDCIRCCSIANNRVQKHFSLKFKMIRKFGCWKNAILTDFALGRAFGVAPISHSIICNQVFSDTILSRRVRDMCEKNMMVIKCHTAVGMYSFFDFLQKFFRNLWWSPDFLLVISISAAFHIKPKSLCNLLPLQ